MILRADSDSLVLSMIPDRNLVIDEKRAKRWQ
jgi:hypothetical protein